MKLPVADSFQLDLRLNADVAECIGKLMWFDSRRQERLLGHYTDKDPSLLEMIEMEKLRMRKKTANHRQFNVYEWTDSGIFTSIEFLISLDFMTSVQVSDKLKLLQNFYMKASIFECAMRTKTDKCDQLITPDGTIVYPKALLESASISREMLNKTRSLLVVKLIELQVTREEFVLLTAIFFCNSGIPKLSENAKTILTTQQKSYASVLLQYCLWSYQRSGPSRFGDLLSVCQVLDTNFNEIHGLILLFQCYMTEIKTKKLTDAAFELPN
ncbi:unnamed protein product [Caenorhabditis sp. 36 PRJEB53466]|nr:unnamed protein product [Caenorhabditis sp. 36 PRJEB53466]